MQFLTLLQMNAKIQRSSRSMEISEKVKHYLEEYYTLPMHTKELEERFHFQFDYLSRCLKRHTGMTPLQYLHYLRMNEAKQLISHCDLSLPDIAEKIGMKDYNYFSRLFRKSFGMSPSDYRNKM
jgi:YesN/AraC family two-component response regulator